MASKHERTQLAKLEGEKNWMVWKIQIKHLLLRDKLWGYVDGSTKCKDSPSADEQAVFDSKCQEAMTIIVLSLASNTVPIIQASERPDEAWEALTQRFEASTLAAKLHLRKRYFRLDMPEGANVERHLTEMQELTDRLSAMGSKISEEDKAMTILGSLPNSYRALVTTLGNQAGNLSVVNVTNAILDEQRRGAPTNASEPDSALVGVSRRQPSSNSGVRNFPPRKCYNCDQPGHISRECRQPRKQQNGNRDKQRALTHNPRRSRGGHHHQAKVAEEVDHNDEFMFCMSETCASDDKGEDWIIDSGATSHMSYDLEIFTTYRVIPPGKTVKIGDGFSLDVTGVGSARINMKLKDGKSNLVTLPRVLHVPDISSNLLSVPVITKRGHKVTFLEEECVMSTMTGHDIAYGEKRGTLYYVMGATDKVSQDERVHLTRDDDQELWHRRLGHVNDQILHKMTDPEIASGVVYKRSESSAFCESCVKGKAVKHSLKPLGKIRSTRPLGIIHSDVCGPMQTPTSSGKKYMITFTDDYTRMCAVYLMSVKSEALDKFKEFQAAAVGQLGCNIGILHSDNGGEYVSTEFKLYLRDNQIKHETSLPRVPEMNGVAERKNRTLLEQARSMISLAKLPKSFWGEAVTTAAYLTNRIPTSSLGGKTTPYELWYEKKPDLKHLRVFGCIAYAHVDTYRRKLDDKAQKLRFLGYANRSRGYRLVDDVTHKVVYSKDVTFNEDRFNFGDNQDILEDETITVVLTRMGQLKSKLADIPTAQSLPKSTAVPPESTTSLRNTTSSSSSTPQAIHDRPKRQTNQIKRFGIEEIYLAEADIIETMLIATSDVIEPRTLREALATPQADRWKKAADEEIQSLQEHNTWDLVNLPPDRKPVGSKWVFKLKCDQKGEIDRYKCRLVAQGFSQIPGLDFDETFAPVARFGIIRALIAFAVNRNMHVHQMDVVTAFLYGKLVETIYMKQPEGYVKSGQEDKVCLLKRSLYGLKQSSRCWYQELQTHLVQMKFQQSRADPCVFFKWENDTLEIVSVYVDDLIMIADIIDELIKLKQELSTRFKMKDIGPLSYCLGIAAILREGEIVIHQKQYLINLLNRFDLTKVAPVSTPVDPHVHLVQDDGISGPTDQRRYQQMVGSLQYAAGGTRPDLAFAVNLVARFCNKPSKAHMTAVIRIFKYIVGTLDLGLTYTRQENSELLAYSDADWAGDQTTRKSTSGNVFLLAHGAITWTSRKQSSVALSTVESEYMALSLATQEAIWLRGLMKDLGKDMTKPTVIYEDNQGAISTAKNPTFHKKTKHIQIRYHFVREAVEENTIEIIYCPTKLMVADIFTKGLTRDKFEPLREKLGLKFAH